MPNQNARLLAYLAVFLALSLGLLSPIKIQAQDNDYHQNFEWKYGDYTYYWNLSIPKSLYDAYVDVSALRRTSKGVAGYGFLTTTEDPYVQMLASKLNESATEEGLGVFETVSFVLAFVQSLQYTSDNVTTNYDEYPRFPIETLVDYGGDCEDTSILFATLMLALGYGAVYINPLHHVAVGVLGDDIDGYYYTYDQERYYYCETTGNGWGIGDMPDEYQNGTAKIYPIKETQQYRVPVVFETPQPTETSSSTPSPQPPLSPQVTIYAAKTPAQNPNQETSQTLETEYPELTTTTGIAAFAAVASLGTLLTRRKPRTQKTPLAKTEADTK